MRSLPDARLTSLVSVRSKAAQTPLVPISYCCTSKPYHINHNVGLSGGQHHPIETFRQACFECLQITFQHSRSRVRYLFHSRGSLTRTFEVGAGRPGPPPPRPPEYSGRPWPSRIELFFLHSFSLYEAAHILETKLLRAFKGRKLKCGSVGRCEKVFLEASQETSP